MREKRIEVKDLIAFGALHGQDYRKYKKEQKKLFH